MSDLLNRTKQHTFKEFTIFKGVIEGVVEGFRQRYYILDNFHWNSFYQTLRDRLLGDATNAILRKIGEDFGNEIFSIVQEKFGADPQTAFLYILQNLEKLGWGAFWNTKINVEGKEITLELHNSAEAYNNEVPSCYHIEGILTGIAKAILGKDIVVREMECIAKGDKICTFRIGDRSIVPELYSQEKITQMIKILQQLKATIKSSVELLATTDGRPIISNLSEGIDSSLWTTIISFVLAGSKQASVQIGTGKLKEVVINSEKGIIIASLITEKILIAVVVGPDTSPGLAGLSVKQAKEKIREVLK